MGLYDFLADAPEGSDQSYDALQMRRKIATELAAQKRPYASNIGEGIASMGDSFANAMNMIALDRQSKAFAAREAELIRGLGGLPGDSAPSSSAPPPPAAAPAAAPSPPATPAALPPIAPAPVTPQGNAPMSQSAIDAGATQDEVNAARMKVASALTNQGLLSRDTIGGQQPQPLVAPPANERMVARPPADAGTPPVVTDIPKAPAPQAQAGYSDPALEPIAPMPKPLEVGPAPVRPPQVPMSETQQKLLSAINNPYLSKNTKDALAARYKVWEEHRQEQQRQSDVDFTFAREDQNKKENQARLEPGKVQAERIGAAQAQAAILRSRQEREQNENAFDKVEVGGRTYQRPKGAAPDVPFTEVPGTGGPQLTEKQGSIVRSFERGLRASEYLGDAKELAGLTGGLNAAAGYGGAAGRAVQSDVYKNKVDAMNSWAEAFLRDESGALIGGQEKLDKIRTFFPTPGDGPQQIALKAQLRAVQEKSVYDSMGTAKPHLDAIIDDRKARAAPGVAENSWRFSASTGRAQVMHNGHWEDPVPGEKPPARTAN